LDREITGDDVILEDAYAGERYGVPTHETLEAIKLAAHLEGMITDPVYEGKSMAGLIDLVQRRTIPKAANVLYVHLGGAPALSAYGALFK
jgi:1-aminocyclopropane-1-carboxylate deaminase